MKRGIELIAEERQRQIDVEGYSEQHDSQHKASELIYAAIAYVESAKVGINCAETGNTNEHEIMMRKVEMGRDYPFGWDFKPSTDVRDLVKAGALIAAAIDRILAELAESEDEKIRHYLMNFVKINDGVNLPPEDAKKALAWIEKQGEPIDKIVKRAMNEKQRVLLTETNGDANIDWDTRSLQDVKLLLEYGLDYIKKLEKQGEKKASCTTIVETGDGGINALVTRELPTDGEQNPTDKVEPKFEVGAWLIFNESHNRVYQVERIDNYRYYLRHYLGGTMSVHFDNELIRLWTLQDAKSGDVLANDTTVLIVDHLGTFENRPIIYSWYFANSNKFCGPGPSEPDRWEVEGFYPATKEQREQLKKAMADAGYTFDFENKKLKKTEPKSKENKGNIGGFSSNSKWSEEDEKTLNEIFSVAARASLRKSTLFGKSYDYIKWQNWLESLRPQSQWKPSKEQIVALRWVLNNVPYNKHKEEISGLLDQIKDL